MIGRCWPRWPAVENSFMEGSKFMAALRTRKEARERIIKAFMESLDKVLPADELVPLTGKTFRDFELQARTLARAL